MDNPSYEDVCNGGTGHAEVLKIEYNPKEIRLVDLLRAFVEMHDPTSKDRQGADIGSQYRSIILYTEPAQKEAIEDFLKKAQKSFDKPIVTQVRKLDKFWTAEEYHKDYYSKNPLQPYCLFVTRPKVEKIKKEFKELLK